MIKEIFLLLKNQSQTLAVAESCTGGALAHEITSISGISQIFLGSITAYSNQAKEQLQVSSKDIQKYGAVSEQVALAMAVGCRKIFSSTWALSTTGIAGPTGGTADKPVGTVWIGICGPKVQYAQKFIFEGSRLEHQRKTVNQALVMLRDALR